MFMRLQGAAASGGITPPLRAIFGGVGSLSGNAVLTVMGQVSFAAAGDMSANATIGLVGAVGFTGAGTLTGAAVVGHAGEVTFSGTGTLTGAGEVGGGVAAFPQILRVGQFETGETSTSWEVILPEHAAGDLILVISGFGNTTNETVDTDLSSEGWSAITSHGGTPRANWLWKVADSSAEELHINGGDVRRACMVYIISGANDVSGSQSTSGTSATSINANPPEHAVSHEQVMNLWLVVGVWGGGVSPSAPPADFTDMITEGWGQSTTAGMSRLATAVREFEGDTLDPASFTSGDARWRCFTLAVSNVPE